MLPMLVTKPAHVRIVAEWADASDPTTSGHALMEIMTTRPPVERSQAARSVETRRHVLGAPCAHHRRIMQAARVTVVFGEEERRCPATSCWVATTPRQISSPR